MCLPCRAHRGRDERGSERHDLPRRSKTSFSPDEILSEFSCLHAPPKRAPPANIVLLSSLGEEQRAICRLFKSGEMSFDDSVIPRTPDRHHERVPDRAAILGIVQALPGRRYGIDTSG